MATPKKDEDTKVEFDPKWLKDLKFTGTEIKKNKGDDGKVQEMRVPLLRPLKENDIMNWKISGDRVVLVTADGCKYRLKK